MKIGIGPYYIDRYGIAEGARRMAADGYGYLDLKLADTESEYYTASDEELSEILERIKRGLESNGIKINQIHGPWRYPAHDATEEERAERFEKMVKAATIAKSLGAKYMAIHPLMPYGANSPANPKEVYEMNKEFYTRLAKIAGGMGITVCIENMPHPNSTLAKTADILALIKDINSPHFKLCFDTGHSNRVGESIREAIKSAGDNLKILHVHDNFGDKDAHSPPYDGAVNWLEFAEALYETNFDGILNLETSPKMLPDFEKMSDSEIREKEIDLAKIAKLLAEN